MKARYDRIQLVVPKGRKAKFKAVADKQGQSVNAFIVTAIDERVERLDGSGGKKDTWDEFDKIVANMEEVPAFDDFPRMEFGRDLVSFEV